MTRPLPPSKVVSRTPSSASATSKDRSPSPEPYEIPIKMLEGDKRRPPPNPPGGGNGPPPPVPKNKPQISGTVVFLNVSKSLLASVFERMYTSCDVCRQLGSFIDIVAHCS